MYAVRYMYVCKCVYSVYTIAPARSVHQKACFFLRGKPSSCPWECHCLQQHYQPRPQFATFAFQTTRTPTNITNIAFQSFSIYSLNTILKNKKHNFPQPSLLKPSPSQGFSHTSVAAKVLVHCSTTPSISTYQGGHSIQGGQYSVGGGTYSNNSSSFARKSWTIHRICLDFIYILKMFGKVRFQTYSYSYQVVIFYSRK